MILKIAQPFAAKGGKFIRAARGTQSVVLSYSEKVKMDTV
jgi:hypothetical protein